MKPTLTFKHTSEPSRDPTYKPSRDPTYKPTYEQSRDPTYKPTEEDILLVRTPTTGVISSTFDINCNKFMIFDVGGQRSERNKWIHCFDSVTAVLFVASLSCYDQALFELDYVNAMQEALNLFDEKK
eukprot:306261_1